MLLTISEVSERLGITIDSLRKWERKGILKPIRTPGGHRRYSEEDITRAMTSYSAREDREDNVNDETPPALHINQKYWRASKSHTRSRNLKLVPTEMEKLPVTVYIRSDALLWVKKKVQFRNISLSDYISSLVHDQFLINTYRPNPPTAGVYPHKPRMGRAWGVIPDAEPLPAKRRQHSEAENLRNMFGGYEEN